MGNIQEFRVFGCANDRIDRQMYEGISIPLLDSVECNVV